VKHVKILSPSPQSPPIKGGATKEVTFPLPWWERVKVRG